MVLQVILKNILSATFARRSGYKTREGRFKYAMGTEQLNPLLRTSLGLTDDTQER